MAGHFTMLSRAVTIAYAESVDALSANMSHSDEASRPSAWRKSFKPCTVYPRGASGPRLSTDTTPSGPTTRIGFCVCHPSVRAERWSASASDAVSTVRQPPLSGSNSWSS